MEKCPDRLEAEEAITAFDALYTTNHMQMLKLLLPYLDMDEQRKLAVLIKWQELIYTLGHSSGPYGRGFCRLDKKEPDIPALLPLLLPYCSQWERSVLSRLSQLAGVMQSYQEMAKYMPLLQELTGAFSGEEGFSFDSLLSSLSGGGDGNPGLEGLMDMAKSMMSPEQMDLFSKFMEKGP